MRAGIIVTIRIANGAGFLGDDIDAPRRLVESAAVDYLTLEYLAELTMSILARLREKDPAAGFAKDFLTVLESSAIFASDDAPRIVTNAGGVNPLACVRETASYLARAGCPDKRLAVVTGDDLLDRLDMLQAAGCHFANAETGVALSEVPGRIVSANAYLGAEPICRALAAGADIVITGRVADASLTLAPAVHEFGWSWDAWKLLAA